MAGITSHDKTAFAIGRGTAAGVSSILTLTESPLTPPLVQSLTACSPHLIFRMKVCNLLSLPTRFKSLLGVRQRGQAKGVRLLVFNSHKKILRARARKPHPCSRSRQPRPPASRSISVRHPPTKSFVQKSPPCPARINK